MLFPDVNKNIYYTCGNDYLSMLYILT